MVEIIANAVDCRVMNATEGVHLELYNLLSYFCDGAENSQAFKSRRWDGRDSFFDMKKQVCPAGFVPLIERHLTKLGIAYRTRRIPLPPPLGPSLEQCQKRTTFPMDPKYSYQHEAVERLLDYGQMIAMVSTGGGKTLIGSMAYWRIQRPTLFVTTRASLAHQMRDFLVAHGEDVGLIGDSVWEPNVNGFTCAMSQTLAARLKDFDEKAEDKKLRYVQDIDSTGKPRLTKSGDILYKRSPAFVKAQQQGPTALKVYEENIKHRLLQLKQAHLAEQDVVKQLLLKFEFVILEEAHESSANGYYRVLRHCRNAHYRLALTATPFVRDSEEANLRLLACSGPIGIKVSERTLIDRGVLATPYFKFIEVNAERVGSRTPWPAAYNLGIVENQTRNNLICDEAMKAVARGLPVLILILRKKHGEALTKQLKARGVNVEFVFGESNAETRKRCLTRLGDGRLDALVGSNIFDVGIDVPSLGMVILGGGGKGEVTLRQRIGRGLRAKKQGPNKAFVVDFMDNGNRILSSHSRQRRKIIESIDGFKQNILQPGQEFDFSEFPTLRSAS